MGIATNELWADLEEADRMGDEELAAAIAARIKEIEARGPIDYVKDIAENLGSIPVGAGEMALQMATGVANRIDPNSGISKYMTTAADNFTSAMRDVAEQRTARSEGDRIGQAVNIGTDIGGYFLPSGVSRRAVAGAEGVLGRIAQETARDVADVTAQGLTRANRDPENFEANLETDAALAGGIGATLRGAGAAIRGGTRGVASRVFDQSPAAVEAEAAASRRGVQNLIRGEDMIQNPAVRNLARGFGDTIDSFTGRNQRALTQMKDQFLDDADAGVGNALDLDFLGDIDKGFVRKYKELQKEKNRLYQEADRELDPILGKLDGVTVSANSGQSLNMRLQKATQDLSDEYGLNHPIVKEIMGWGQYQPAKFSTWANRRRALARELRGMKKSADPDYNKIDAYKRVLKELDDQLDDWAGENNSWRKANKFYREFYKPYKTNNLLKRIESKDPDEGLRGDLLREQLMRPGKDPRDFDVNVLYKALDEDGQAAVYRALIQRVKNAATRDGEGVEIPWSPGRAATELANIQQRLKMSAPSAEVRRALDDWRKIFRGSEQVGMDAGRSPTGRSFTQMAGPVAVIGGAAGASAGGMDPTTAAGLGGGTLGLMLAVRSPRFRATMRKLADMDPKHPDRALVEDQLAAMISKAAAGGTDE